MTPVRLSDKQTGQTLTGNRLNRRTCTDCCLALFHSLSMDNTAVLFFSSHLTSPLYPFCPSLLFFLLPLLLLLHLVTTPPQPFALSLSLSHLCTSSIAFAVNDQHRPPQHYFQQAHTHTDFISTTFSFTSSSFLTSTTPPPPPPPSPAIP